MNAATIRYAAATALLVASMAGPGDASAQTLIGLADGDVQGQVNGGTREFLGIPFAAPPVGSLRFAPPVPPDPWVGTLDATTYPPGCAQLPVLTNGDTRIENEDCLYLNVWTPDPAPAEPLPVMLWIHGGSNATGSISDFVPFPGYEGVRLFDGSALVENGDVVVVTTNYRLNVFGFLGLPELAAEDPGYPYAGNQGLLDQRAAMEWVRDNISAFGGDPGNVTIFGESAGSFDVCAHVVSPGSRGLFHRAISESGGCTVGIQTAAESSAAADTVAEAVGCDLAPDRLACMRAAPLADLLDAGPLVAQSGEDGNLGIAVDGGFLEEHPRDTFARGRRDGGLPKLPYLLGANLDEGTLFFIGSPELTPAEYTAELVSAYGASAPEIEALYPAGSFPTPRDALIRVWGDAVLTCSTYDTAKRYTSKRNRAWVYNFQRVPPEPFIGALGLGAFHGLEIAYVFGSTTPPTTIDETVAEYVQGFWTSFADRGRPKIKGIRRWPRYNPRYQKVQILDRTLDRVRGFMREKCDFWSSYYDLSGS